VIAVIAFDHTFQPLSYDGNPFMHPLTQHRFDLAQCRLHPLGLGCASYDEIAFGVRRTVVREPQNREGGGFTLTTKKPRNLVALANIVRLSLRQIAYVAVTSGGMTIVS
jgi:hypothetical protein